MKSECRHCGGVLAVGRATPTEVSPQGMAEPNLAFIVSRGVRSSWNPIKAIIQGLRRESKYEEQTFPLRAAACVRCGAVEFFLKEKDREQLAEWLEG